MSYIVTPQRREFCLRAQSSPTLWDPLAGTHQAPVHGIFQARRLEWVAISSSRGTSPPRDWTWVSWASCIDRRILLPPCHLGSPPDLPVYVDVVRNPGPDQDWVLGGSWCLLLCFSSECFSSETPSWNTCLSLLQARLCPHRPDSFVEVLTSNVLEDVFGDVASEKVVGVHWHPKGEGWSHRRRPSKKSGLPWWLRW